MTMSRGGYKVALQAEELAHKGLSPREVVAWLALLNGGTFIQRVALCWTILRGRVRV